MHSNSAQGRRRPPRSRPVIVQTAQVLRFDLGLNAREISEELERRFPGEGVSERTVGYWIKHWGTDASGAWSLTSGHVEVAASVLRILPDLVELRGQQALNISVAEAEVLGRLAAVVPSMPPAGMFRWTGLYLAALRADLPTRDLLAYLAFSPWADKGARYLKAFDAGHLTTVLSICPGDDDWLAADRRERHSFSVGAVIVAPRRRSSRRPS